MVILERGHNGNHAATQMVPALAPASAGSVYATVQLLSVEGGYVKDQPWKLPTVPEMEAGHHGLLGHLVVPLVE